MSSSSHAEPEDKCLHFVCSIFIVSSHSTGKIEDERVCLRPVLEAESQKLHRISVLGIEAEHGGTHAMDGMSNTEPGDLSTG